jgi:hypothetical protein
MGLLANCCRVNGVARFGGSSCWPPPTFPPPLHTHTHTHIHTHTHTPFPFPDAVARSNGGSVDVSAEVATVDAIVEAGYPGVLGGTVIAQTLFGDNEHVGGKLPYTLYPADFVNQIPMSEMELDVGVGRG